MPRVPAGGWSLRLVAILGVPLEQVAEHHLEQLVQAAVREDADLDFKEDRYGNSDSARRELAADIAAMANDRGGLIVIGIRDENDVASAITPVGLVEGEEARIRQVAAANIAPYVDFDVRVVESAAAAPEGRTTAEQPPSLGYYLIIVPPSTLRPHAVRKNQDLRFPRRAGSTTHWLSEAEAADMYRNRFTVAESQADRLERVMAEGLAAMDLGASPHVAVGLVPTGGGSMPINLARVRQIEAWVRDLGRASFSTVSSSRARRRPRASARIASMSGLDTTPPDQRRTSMPSYMRMGLGLPVCCFTIRASAARSPATTSSKGRGS